MNHNQGLPLEKSQLLRLVDYFSSIFGRLTEPGPDELPRLITRLDGIVPPDATPTSDPAIVYRTGQVLYYTNGPPSMSELSEALGVPLYRATRIVSWWVENGLAERLSDPADRRVVRVALTNKGRRFHEIVEDFACGTVKEVIDCLTEYESYMLIALLSKIALNMRSKASAAGQKNSLTNPNLTGQIRLPGLLSRTATPPTSADMQELP